MTPNCITREKLLEARELCQLLGSPCFCLSSLYWLLSAVVRDHAVYWVLMLMMKVKGERIQTLDKTLRENVIK